MEIGLETVAALAAVALCAGFFDAIAGGGGLLTVPALLLAGFDPVAAVATNKLQGSFGTLSATVAFARAGRIDWRDALPMAAAAAVGSVAGAGAVRLLSPTLLAAAVPVLLVSVALYFWLGPRMGEADVRRRMPPWLFALTVAPVVGFYDGIFGPGAGSFYMVGFVTLLGLGLVRATAHTKLLNAASNVASLLFYIAVGLAVWPVGLAMGVSAMVGAQLGSRLAMRKGAALIRPLLILVCCATAARLLLDPANPWRRAVAGLLAGG
ncbi:TSUP family transporter [Alsobacter sp. R-9]